MSQLNQQNLQGVSPTADLTRHFLSLADHTTDRLRHILETGFTLRDQREQGQAQTDVLTGKTLLMIFEKPSLRTRISFEQAMIELGGAAIVQSGAEVGVGERESSADVARVVEGMVQGLCARVFEHQKLIDLAAHSQMPVINALSDESHPCQALADLMTILDEYGRDFSQLAGKTVAFVGDGNNVARSLALICARFDIRFNLAAPPGYEFSQQEIDQIMRRTPQLQFECRHDPIEAVRYADVIYTDTWVSMGQEEEKQQRINAFGDYQINADLMRQAPEHAIVLHCLPAYRGYEITDEVIDGPQSRVFPQAHNRLHAQKGLLAVLLGDR